MNALAANGALGVARALRLLRDELEIAMALTGCRTLAEAGPALLSPIGNIAVDNENSSHLISPPSMGNP